MLHSQACSARVLFLASFVLGCGSEGVAPGEEPALHNRLVFETEGGIGVMAPDGSQQQLLPIGSDLELASSPVVSPDGRRVAFSGLKGGQFDLYVMNVDGSGRQQLTNDLGQDLLPAWAPDGGSLLFHWTGVAPGAGQSILTVIGADGSGRRELLVDGYGGTWSPDGHRVAFTGAGSLAPGIYAMDADGSNVTRLDQGCGPNCTDGATRWSPDGQFLAFTRVLAGVEAAGVMRADGSEARLVLPTLRTGGAVWSPDGQRLVLTRMEEEGASIYLVTLASADTVRLAGGFVTDWTR